MEWGDFFNIDVSGSFDVNKPSDSFTRQYTHYADATTDDDQLERYNDTHSNSYDWSASANYHFALPGKWFITPQVGYSQSWNDNHNSNYLLNLLGNLQPHDLGWLPSTYDSLQLAKDPLNSDDNQLRTHTYTGALNLSHSNDNYYFSLNIPYKHIAERLHYDDGFLDTIARRHSNMITPSVRFYMWKGGMKYATYSFNVNRPELASLMPTDETVDPLVWRINNPELKNHASHNLRLYYSQNTDSLKRSFSVWANGRLDHNNWGTRTIYDEELGTYTYFNDNVNGNWGTDFGASGTIPLDKKRRLLLTDQIDADYDHSVDFDIQHIASMIYILGKLEEEKGPLSTVNNWRLHNRLQLQYQLDDLSATLSGNITWRNSTGDRQNFQSLNAFDFDYGASVTYTIPWVKLTLATDLRMYSRRGYYSSMMNDNHLVWNALLSRSFFKQKLTAKLQAFDLLHQLSSTQYSVNAQGRTETWNNCIPRYVMLSLQYKFQKMPKKK